MTRNSIAMEKLVVHFNETVVVKMTHRRRAHNPGDKRFFKGKVLRPPFLTKRERPRFIRAAYQRWSLILLDLQEGAEDKHT
ncbi:uncharacterized protein N7473_003900 [Penicillium subrubescens]|uniref:uncharacterized protein n=1 Tax=Penicillium subrubescens TaxID=1316194 RepID=UPI00254568FA|nr:uncharacterized protein N7473_003900 [Penicillium subrubescens]KAJ5906984.1 hypothetical protein N7473_003900 [Penicillium subrubescens]